MPTRDQLNQEKLDALLKELGDAGIIDSDEAEGLRVTREFQEAEKCRKETPEPKTVTREKVSDETHEKMVEARDESDFQAQLDIIYEILTGVDPSDL